VGAADADAALHANTKLAARPVAKRAFDISRVSFRAKGDADVPYLRRAKGGMLIAKAAKTVNDVASAKSALPLSGSLTYLKTIFSSHSFSLNLRGRKRILRPKRMVLFHLATFCFLDSVAAVTKVTFILEQ